MDSRGIVLSNVDEDYGEELKEGECFLNSKPLVQEQNIERNKKKHFGTSENMKDFIPSHNLNPEDYKKQGFIVDKQCVKVGKLL